MPALPPDPARPAPARPGRLTPRPGGHPLRVAVALSLGLGLTGCPEDDAPPRADAVVDQGEPDLEPIGPQPGPDAMPPQPAEDALPPQPNPGDGVPPQPDPDPTPPQPPPDDRGRAG